MSSYYLTRLQKKRLRADRQVALLITLGGWLVLVALLALVWHLVVVAAPLLSNPSLQQTGQWRFPAQSSFEEFLPLNDAGSSVSMGADCTLSLWQPDPKGQLQRLKQQLRNCDGQHKLVAAQGNRLLAEISAQLRLQLFKLEEASLPGSVPWFSVRLPSDLEVTAVSSWQLHLGTKQITLSFSFENGYTELLTYGIQDRELISRHNVATATVAIGTASRKLLALLPEGGWLIGGAQPQFYQITSPELITLLRFSPNGRSIYVAYQDGSLRKMTFSNVSGQPVLAQQYEIEQVPLQNLLFDPQNDLFFLVADRHIHTFNATTGELLDVATTAQQVKSARMLGSVLVLSHEASFSKWQVENPSAATTLASLWQKIWYDGYPEPSYVWQTTSAADSNQAKYSVVPLLMGTLKAAFLAILVALPIGLGAAVYCGFFLPFKVRRIVKPTVELIEMIPSVVIGFVAAIWLMPVAEKYLLGLFLFLFLAPFLLLVFSLISNRFQDRLPWGWESLFLVVCVLLFMLLFDFAFTVTGEAGTRTAFDHWVIGLYQEHINKNTLVLALALGFAIIPTVFTIAEDAINEVPKSLKMASFAMGATQVQTLERIVLVAALPGIIAAAMLGFARAFGETMIVLLVSGNTPVASWDLLEGVRTLTANLAIELPEAQINSTHYRILFFTALLLFTFTFVLNSLAEVLRLRSRRFSVGAK